MLSGRNEANLQRVAQECSSVGEQDNALIVAGDVTDETANKRLIEETIQKYGKLK